MVVVKTTTRGLLVYGLIMVFLLSIVSPGLASPTAQEGAGSQIYSAFPDVSEKDANLAFINYLSSKGIIKGFPDGGFHPEKSLTRAQAATIVVLAGRLKTDPAAASPFPDVRADHWARANIAAAVQAGYISGFPDQTFHPEEQITRAQASSMILRLSKQPMAAELPQLSDMNSSHWAAPAVAVGIASGMLGLSADQQQVYPERAMSRGDLARALGVLITKDPDLNQAALAGKIQVKKGSATIQNGSNQAKSISGSSVVMAGDTITTDKKGEADISFGDGSGLLLKEDSQLIIKEARGRSYIKANGTSGIAIEWLLVDLKKGKLFGALASSSQDEENQGSIEKKTTGYTPGKKLIASLEPRELIAATPISGQDMPWYETSKTKKVKVKVDMPWGVAAIRGTFWNNIVNNNGSGSTSILTGSGEVTAGGQTVSLGAMQATQVTGANTPPAPPAAMTPTQMSVWSQAATWAQQRAEAIQQSQEVNPQAQAVIAPTQSTQPAVVPGIVQTINQAINQVQSGAASQPGSSGGGSSGSTTPVTPVDPNAPLGVNLGSYSLTDRIVVSTVYSSNQVLTQDFNVTPSADLAARATQYELWAQLGINHYEMIGSRTTIGQPIRHLKKVFNQPDKLRVVFFDNNNYQPVASSVLSAGNSLTNQATRTISGTISLPNGQVAPAGGMRIRVYAYYSQGSYGFYGDFRQEINIPAGSSSAAYSIAVLPHPAGSNNGYRLYYNIIGTYSEKYVLYGLYDGLVDVSAGDRVENMTIQMGEVIHGTIILPQPADAEVRINLCANPIRNGNNNPYEHYNTYKTIANGSSSVDYSLAVPVGADYQVYYSFNYDSNNVTQEFLTRNKYLRQGYYNNAGTAARSSEATLIPVNTADVPNIDVTVLSGNKISGTISLANNMLAPGGGTYVYVSANGPAGSAWLNAEIPANSNSTTYDLIVYPGIYNVYFSGPGNNCNSSSVDASSGDISNIDAILTLGDVGGGTAAPIPPEHIANQSVLVGNKVFGLDCPDFTDDNVLAALPYGNNLYYKNNTGEWFDLANSAAVDAGYLVTGNAVQNPDTALPPIYYGPFNQITTSSTQTTYYFGAGFTEAGNFTMNPPDTDLQIVNQTDSAIAQLSLQNLGNGNWQGTVAAGSSPGTNVVTVKASCAGYSDMERVLTIHVVPFLTPSPGTVVSGYSAELVSLGSAPALWNSGETVGIQLFNTATGGIAGSLSSSNTTTDSVEFILPLGLNPGEYAIYVVMNGAPVAASKIQIMPAV